MSSTTGRDDDNGEVGGEAEGEVRVEAKLVMTAVPPSQQWELLDWARCFIVAR